jgi:hypothetical protein
MVYLYNAKHVVHTLQEVVYKQSESRIPIKVNDVEDCSQQPSLELLGRVVDHDNRDKEEQKASEQKNWKIVNV